jgi:hypothetical protein
MWWSIYTGRDTRYKCLTFVPGGEPRPGKNVPSPSNVAGGHLYRVEVPPGTNDGFFVLCFFSLSYLLKVLITNRNTM